MRAFFVVLVVSTMLLGCGGRGRPRARTDSGPATDAGMGTDGGTMGTDGGTMGTDGGTMGTDGGTMGTDGGSSDPCEATAEEATSTVGCNGGLLGSSVPDNGLGGRCTGGDPEEIRGTCTGVDDACWALEGSTMGLCVRPCTPSSEAYITTGDCPTGTRCFRLTDGPFCFADCNAGSDCSTGACDSEGSCIPPDA